MTHLLHHLVEEGAKVECWTLLKSVPILYAVIVKLFQLMIEKKLFEEISLVYVSRIPSRFFDGSSLEKIEVLHCENEEEKFSF